VSERSNIHPWWRGAVLYEIYPRSFLDSGDDGVGDLRGIMRRLDYVADLGVDGVWICPFFPSPMKDFGYDVTDYCGVDPLFGNMADFDALLAEAHKLSLKIIIDQVWSHTSDRHPWFSESRMAPSGDKSDWYVWADPKPDGTPPNNWLSVFGGSAWTWEPRRRQYYLHHFLSAQPQLNLRNEKVVAALFDVGKFWLDRGVDGFRLDAVDFMFHDPLLRDNPPRAIDPAIPPARPFGMQRHIYDMLQPELLDFMRRMRGLMSTYPGTMAMGEISSEPGALGRVATYTDTREQRLDLAYTLAVMKIKLNAASLHRVLAEATAATDWGGLCWAFSNHDTVRAVSRWSRNGASPQFAKMLMGLLVSLPGSACVYQGEELGLPEAELLPSEMRDPYGIAFYPSFKGRDGARTPMPWTTQKPWAGFTRATRPWLPVPPSHIPYAAAAQENDATSVLNHSRRLLRWRKQQPALVTGGVRAVPLSEPLFAIERATGDDRVLAVFNLEDRPVRVARESLPDCAPLDGHGFTGVLTGQDLSLGPHDAFFARIPH